MLSHAHELRRDGEVVVATGRVAFDEPYSADDELALGAGSGRAECAPAAGETRLILERREP